MCRPTLATLLALLGLTAAYRASTAAEVQLERTTEGVRASIAGELFADYRVDLGPKPILWPLVGPDGVELTRAHPMREVAGEKQDHIHQRSCWFTHGSVNGVDFWSENPGHGSIKSTSIELESGPAGTILVTSNDWLGPDGQKICEDHRRIRFAADDERRFVDFDIRVQASAGSVTFGDTKEGSFGIRVPTAMDVDNKVNPGGKIVNSEGQTDEAAWGKPAKWVDYSGIVAEKPMGIAIFNHPTSFRYPTHWHVRPYGLFAANPFGLHDYHGTTTSEGEHTIPAGAEMRLRYRVVLHRGAADAEQLESLFAAYADEP